MQSEEQSVYKNVVEAILASGKITEEDARTIYGMGPDAVVFALLAMQSQRQLGSQDALSRPSATVAPYEKPDTKSSRKKKPGRKAGFTGTSRKSPERVDREKTHVLSQCPDCGGDVSQEKTPRVRYTEDLPEKATSEVTKHNIYRSWCPTCHKKVEPVVTDALPNSQIGLRLMAFTAWLHYALGTTISQVIAVLNHHLCMQLTPGALTSIWQRLAEILTPWYEDLQKEIKEAKVIHCDETSWRVDGKTHWVWCIASQTVTFFMIERSRGSPALLKFFTEVFEGTMVTDFWGAYNRVMARSRQMCLVHLLRELKVSDHPTPFLLRSGLSHFFASVGVFLPPKHLEWGDHRVLREVFLPQSGSQQSHLAKGMRLNPLQHIHQIGIGVYPVKLTGHKQALNPPNTDGSKLTPAEEVISPAHRYHA